MARDKSKEHNQVRTSVMCARVVSVRSLLIGSIILLVGLAIIFIFRSPDESTNVTKVNTKRTTIKEVVPTASYNKKQVPIVDKVTKPTIKGCEAWEKVQGLDPSLFPYEDGRKVIETRTNGWIAVDICIMPNGVRRKVRRNVSKQLFKHVTDMVLMQALSTGADEAGPPIPFSADMEDDFLESLKTPIAIDDDDTPEQRKIKEMVIVARENIAEQIRKGSTFFDAISEHVESQKTGQSAREAVMDAVTQLRESGDSDLIDEYLKESNKVLEGMGVGKVLKSDIEEKE